MPPSTIDIKGGDFILEEEYSFPSDVLEKGSGSWDDGLEYDILIDWPYAEANHAYHLDIETQSDFLTG
jgi:hypothetical protein